MVAESGQLDLVDLLSDQLRPIEDGIADIETTLNPQIDANPNDKLLMEMLDVVTDARESIEELRDLVQTMRKRDESEQI
jgi:signal transduction histidine kinase